MGSLEWKLHYFMSINEENYGIREAVGRRDFYSEVRDLISKYKSNMETRVNSNRAIRIIKRISSLSSWKFPP